jgi:hypothetical protein
MQQYYLSVGCTRVRVSAVLQYDKGTVSILSSIEYPQGHNPTVMCKGAARVESIGDTATLKWTVFVIAAHHSLASMHLRWRFSQAKDIGHPGPDASRGQPFTVCVDVIDII